MLGPALDLYNSILCISIPETLLHVTLKRRAEISADIFARLLRYFFLSCKNLTIIRNISCYIFETSETTKQSTESITTEPITDKKIPIFCLS